MANASGILPLSTNNSSCGFCSPKSVYVSKRVSCSSANSPESRPPRLIIISKGCKLVGCGSAVPNQQVTNDDLSKIVDTSDEWISSRTGIRNRRILTGKETLTGLAVEAAQKALEMAEVKADDVDLILFCSSTPHDLFGGAPEVQKTLGCKRNPPAFDIRAACSGFLLGLVSASCHIRGGGFENVLVIGADCVTRYVDWTDRKTCVLFGDAAGAVLVQACDSEDDGLYGFDMHTDGGGSRYLNAGIKHCETNFTLSSNGSNLGLISPSQSSISHIQMNGQEVQSFPCTKINREQGECVFDTWIAVSLPTVKAVPESIATSLTKAGLRLSDIDWLLLHQANQRIIDHVATKLEFPRDRVISNLANYGNTSAATIPLALDEVVRSGRVKEGQTILTAGFGAGLTWGSAIVRWG